MEEPVLYKYLSSERLDSFINDRKLRFTQLQALNDPFESSVSGGLQRFRYGVDHTLTGNRWNRIL